MYVITYDHPHRKTQDVVAQLMMRGITNITLVILPFKTVKPHNPYWNHRPKAWDVRPQELSTYFGLAEIYCNPSDVADVLAGDTALIAGAGIITPIKDAEIINSHPGYLPNVRGLDALKWAIYEGQPIGVTTHFISDEPDEGALIDRKIIGVNRFDTFHSLAQRVYETEITMLIDAIGKRPTASLKDSQYKLHGRMNREDELLMMSRFKRLTE